MEPNHRCRSKFLMLLGTDDDEDEQVSASALPVDSMEETHVAGDISSLHAMASEDSPRSLRLLGSICDLRVQVLIDSGSTHNFIKPSTVEFLVCLCNLLTLFAYISGMVTT